MVIIKNYKKEKEKEKKKEERNSFLAFLGNNIAALFL